MTSRSSIASFFCVAAGAALLLGATNARAEPTPRSIADLEGEAATAASRSRFTQAGNALTEVAARHATIADAARNPAERADALRAAGNARVMAARMYDADGELRAKAHALSEAAHVFGEAGLAPTAAATRVAAARADKRADTGRYTNQSTDRARARLAAAWLPAATDASAPGTPLAARFSAARREAAALRAEGTAQLARGQNVPAAVAFWHAHDAHVRNAQQVASTPAEAASEYRAAGTAALATARAMRLAHAPDGGASYLAEAASDFERAGDVRMQRAARSGVRHFFWSTGW